ncbi:HHL207Cp [Eremothecium sinecaudum]|uniref:HHL207Cp n=1 Tax=Eremothecium sinecaudum TaxID=45286 RepID=A0A109V0M0_9SACH|nr:HHL207Cp [Eremothecium sinecaudum]AMD22563.1 HHL207Cp [Eremothecium sinecaudum]
MLYLVAKASLSDNIKCFYPKDDEASPINYTFELICTSCRETHDSLVRINCFEKHSMPGSRGEASLVMKCNFCGKECSINLERTEEVLYNTSIPDNEEDIKKMVSNRKKLGLKGLDSNSAAWLQMDCRGCEVTKFETADAVFQVELASGKSMECVFEDGENEWYDYDDDAGEEVSVVDVKFITVKGK